VTRLLIIRHGQSEWNAVGRWQGQADSPLTDLGRTQARNAAERIGSVDVVVASDLQRATETALVIAETIGVGPVLTEPGLRERLAGEWSGLTRVEIERDYPGWLAAGRRPPGFEDPAAFLARVRAALDRIETDHAGADVLVVAHGGVVRALEEAHGVGGERIPNLGGRVFQHHGSRLDAGEPLELIDDELRTVPGQL